jgi:TP901 family phage tail tape measure protein
LIFQGVEQMYQRLAMIKKRASMQDKGDLITTLTGLREITASNSKLLNDTLVDGVSRAISKMDEATGQSISQSFDKLGKGTQAFAGMQKKLGGKMGEVFDFSAISNGQAKLFMMTRKYLRLQEEERRTVRKAVQEALDGSMRKQAAFEAERASLELLHDAGEELSENEEQRYNELVDDLIPAIKEKIRQQKIDVGIMDEIERQTEEVTKDLDKAGAEMKEFTDEMRGGVHAVKEGFNNALRNSVALLTAFGYKLNQHTQDLILFERELLNANSVFQLTNDELFNVSNEILAFGNQYGIATDNAAQGLYQLASAGLTAAEAAEVMPHTLKLSMAVQGDHNTLAKLTTQVIKGYGMEMSDAAVLTDKFAHAIQKSLIEWQDLASAVKFAMPFFTSTGQSIDQLLGSLQILTDRALEAGIAGRGLRQALAEFAESALDAEVGFRKMGVEILNSEGEMLQLTEIAAQFAEAVGEDISNTELLTVLIEDLNVRGATAFVHLVQASDKFTQAVKDTENAGGELDKMVETQNASLQAQIEILKTSVLTMFAFRDANYEGTEFINAFHEALVNTVKELQGLFVVMEDGVITGLTPLGEEIQRVAVDGVEMIADLIVELIDILREFADAGFFSTRMLRLMILPMQVLLEVLNFLGPDLLKIILYMKILGSIMPMQTLAWIAMGSAIKSGATGMTLFNAASKRFLMMAGGLGLAIGGLFLLKEGIDWYQNRASGGYVTPMASGGRPRSHMPYLVGEQGPELFMPDTSGQLLNSMQTQDTMGGRTVMKNVTIGIDSFGGMV